MKSRPCSRSSGDLPLRIGFFTLEPGRNVGGLEVYEVNLIRALARIDRVNEYVVVCLNPRVPELLDVHADNVQFAVLPTSRFKGVLWDGPRYMASAGLDLFHAPFVPPPFTSIPYVYTCHGSEVLERPDFYPFALGLRMRILFRRALKKARLIICVSDYVRDYLANKRGIPRSRLRTIYHGVSPAFRNVDKVAAGEFVRKQYGLTRPYVIALGRIEPRKNLVRLVEAYHRFRERVPNPPLLVVSGMKTWSATDFDRAVGELGLADHVFSLGHVSHKDLPKLYASSEFAVFTSLWEGFGLPVVEAFAAETPLITSNTTSLPEVSNGASLLVNPHSAEDIADAMCALHSDSRLRDELIRKGRARVDGFSWERTARETRDAYEAVANLTQHP